MRQTIDLNRGWKFTWREFEGRLDAPPRLPGPVPFRDARVPGDAHLDLMRHGLLPDLFVGMNLDQARWMEQKDWWYAMEFETPRGGAGRRAFLVFHGLDTFGTVWLNGQLLGRTDNMHLSHEFEVTGILRESGPNELVVRLASAMHSIRIDPEHKPLIWSPERLFCRKAQMSFGWDIAPRLMTVGIWRPVELVLCDAARIADVRIVPERIDGGDVAVQVEVEVDWFEDEAGAARVRGTIHETAWLIEGMLQPGRNVLRTMVSLKSAPLWWPLGYGAPSRVEVSVSLESLSGDRAPPPGRGSSTGSESSGRVLDERRFLTGFRTIELVEEPQPSGATSFRFRCNGRDLFITGLNWTPLDAIFARITPEKITRTLEAVAAAGCNMLRVWGGGIYEPQHFYDECDRLGILVWQDFMMACGWYPQTDAMAAALEAEARQVVRDLRNHPCIALWAGDNECDVFEPELAPKNRLTRVVLAGVCRDLHPQVPYLPSSPYSPRSADPQDEREGDVHWYAHGQDYRKSRLWSLRPRFMSEFGILSLPPLDLIRRYWPAGTEWPLTNEMWRYHGTDTTRTGRFRVADCVLRSLEACGRPAPRDIAEAVAASQDLQAEAIVALIERYAEDPEFGGFLVWNVADCWPQHSDSVLDYEGNAKAVFGRLGPLFRRLRRARGGD